MSDRQRAIKAMNSLFRLGSEKVLKEIIKKGTPHSEPAHLSEYCLVLAKRDFAEAASVRNFTVSSEHAAQINLKQNLVSHLPDVLVNVEKSLAFNIENKDTQDFKQNLPMLVADAFRQAGMDDAGQRQSVAAEIFAEIAAPSSEIEENTVIGYTAETVSMPPPGYGGHSTAHPQLVFSGGA